MSGARPSDRAGGLRPEPQASQPEALIPRAITIEKGIPIPPIFRAGRSYPFREMEVGDSFWMPRKSASNRIAYYHKTTEFRFVQRLESGGTRVWRIA